MYQHTKADSDMTIKTMFGSTKYSINSERKIFNNDYKECTPVITDNKIRIAIHGKVEWVDLDWLWYTSVHECKLTREQYGTISNIYYVPKIREGIFNNLDVEMKFRNAIVYKEGFRIVPNYTNLAVSRKGVVISIQTGEIIESKINKTQYPSFNFYNSVLGKSVSIAVHRLVALAWIHNPNPLAWQVNHIDGDKTNFHWGNLEWTTPSENNLHACRTGLRDDVVGVKIQDCKDWTVHEFPSLSDAGRFLGAHIAVVRNQLHKLRPNLLYKGRYDVKLLSDDTEWFYKKGDRIGSSRYVITVKLNEDDIRTYYDSYHVKQDLGIWNVSNIEHMLEKGRELYPDAEFSYVDNCPTDKVQCLTIATGEIETADTIMYFAKKTGIHKTTIRRCILKGSNISKDGYAFRYAVDTKWDTETFEELVPLGRCISARNTKTNEVLKFKSLRALARHFKIDRSVITLRLNTELKYLDWLFEDIE